MSELSDAVDPTLTPGSYELQKGGHYVRTDEPTKPAERQASPIDVKAARALAAANERIGFPAPPEVAAVIEADDAERAKAKAASRTAPPAAHTPGAHSAPAPKDA